METSNKNNNKSKSKSTNKSKSTKEKKPSRLYVVGVGASAGGLDALSRFLSSFNGSKAEFCVVIVMHLSPDHKSELSNILTKRSKWPVENIENNVSIKSGIIYVTHQNCDLHLEGNVLKLENLPPKHLSAPSIDKFFKSLAESKQKEAIGIILSGFGSDGSKGITAIKEKGGFTIAQLPKTAEHDSMPKAAIETKNIDAIVPAEQMFEEIKHYLGNSFIVANGQPKKKNIDAIFEMLEKRSGTDFSLYKPTTIMRRINHRLSILQLGSVDEYYELIKKSPSELDFLFETVLIGVTEFFRDQEAFESLKKSLTDLIQKKQPGDPIRLWSVGCATGEEPFTLSIILHEILGKKIKDYHVQIFASDIDEKALRVGRKGIYHKDLLEKVSIDHLNKYFEKVDEKYFEIKKEIKQYVLFAKHDISNDPPFVKLDVISCRNLIIYFNNDLQKQTLKIFHYALKSGGLLFLGKSESVSVAADLFDKMNNFKIFRKSDSTSSYNIRFSRFKKDKTKNKKYQGPENKQMSVVDIAKETVYRNFEHPFIIINDDAEIKEVHGSVRLYLEVQEGSMNTNLYKMANKEIANIIKALHTQCKRSSEMQISPTLKFNLFNESHNVRIKISPLLYRLNEIQYYLVIFEKVVYTEHDSIMQQNLDEIDFTDLRIKKLEDELDTTREHLQIFTEELESTNEELQSINEEFQSSNEELKSSNEELETSNEELQSANEELNTANNELRTVNEALIQKETELKKAKKISERNQVMFRSIAENIPNGSVGILNSKLEIEYLAGQGLPRFNVPPDEMIGKRLLDFNASKAEIEKLTKVFKNTLKGKHGNVEFYSGGRLFNLLTVPLKINGDASKLMYLTQDVTDQRKRELQLNLAINAANLLTYEWNAKLDIFETNPELNEMLGYDKNLILSGAMFMDKIHKDDHPHIIEQWNEAISTGIIRFEVRVLVEKIKWIRVDGRLLFDNDNNPERIVATIIDITENKEFTQKLEELVAQRTTELEDSNTELLKVNLYLEEYAYVASHDLQEPLRKIRTFISIIKRSSTEDEKMEYTDKIEKSASQMTSLVKNILDYSKLAGDSSNLEAVDLDSLFQEIVEDAELLIEETDAQISFDDLGTVPGMPIQLLQLFGNIVKNALKFNDNRPILTITSEKISGTEIPEKERINKRIDYLLITITDNGIGIKEEHLDLIFKPFKRFNSNSKYGGTGIGLAIAKRIVDLHKGVIKVDSSKEEGTSFKIYLPMAH